ncbi:tripartite motif-containing protein 16-like [Centroberyx gerrardi]
MAQQGIQLDGAKLCCSICLDLLKDPVTIPCGHSYCMSCIKSCWDEEDQKKIHSCPQCRQTFTPRPVLVKNTMLAELVEDLKKTGLQAAPPDRCYAGPGDVACDVCTGRKLKALKSCLVCLASYCEQHLQPHYDAAPLKKHKLVEATMKLQENICSRHDEVMKIFCRTDQQCICYLCSMDEHKGHDTVSAAAEWTERQKELGVSRQKIQQRIQDREKDVKVLQQEVEAINLSADKAVEDSEKIFTELVRLIEKRSSDVKEQIRSQQKAEASRAEELQEKLKQEIAELRRKDAELEQLSHTEDHTHFLHNYPSLSRLSESTDSPSTNIRPLRYFEDVTAAVSEARDKLQGILTEEWTKISWTVTEVDVLLSQPREPKTRAEFLQYSRQITLDPNTANTQLSLSEGNRKATFMREKQLYSSHPDRFTEWSQVLSREGLTGRCYWEVEWRGSGVSIAVAYKDISRTGTSNECLFGNNDKSWALYYYYNSYHFRHNNITTPIPVPRSSRVGVYLDHRAGILSFYSVSETMTLLHRVQTTFTQPLYPGLWLHCYYGVTAELSKLK